MLRLGANTVKAGRPRVWDKGVFADWWSDSDLRENSDNSLMINPGEFYILKSKEKIKVPQVGWNKLSDINKNV